MAANNPTFQACFDTLLKTVQIPTKECLPLLFSRGLGVAMVALSPASKAPQIVNLVRSKSAEGILVQMFVLEVAVFSISWAYQAGMNLAFAEYGEAVILNWMTVIIVILVLKYSPGGLKTLHLLLMVAYFIVLGAMLSGLVPLVMLRLAFTWSVLFNIGGRVPQILTNWRNGTTGQLSLVMFVLNLGGSAVRVLTSFVQIVTSPQWSTDLLFVFGNYVLSAALNGVLTLQILYYSYYLKTASGNNKKAE